MLVLASASRSRALLLERAGLTVTCDPAHIDEGEIKAAFRGAGGDAAACAMALAEAKAARVARRHSGALVIGADQLLVCGEDWFDKPADLAAARRQLHSLRGRRHELVTAVVLRRDDVTVWHHLARPVLTMRDFSDGFLDDYLAAAGPEVLSTVGAYQLEALGVQLFARIEGDYFAILGLPLLPLLDYLRGAGELAP
jgi:septum formation protein